MDALTAESDQEKTVKYRGPNFLNIDSDFFKPDLEEELLTMIDNILTEYKKYGDPTFKFLEIHHFLREADPYYKSIPGSFFEEEFYNDFIEDVIGCVNYMNNKYKKYDINKIFFLKYLNYRNIMNCIEERINEIY
jgi:hypothetical protein